MPEKEKIKTKTKTNSRVKGELGKKGKRIILTLFWMAILGPFVIMFLSLLLVSSDNMPSFEELENPRNNEATIIYSADGKTLGKYFHENRVNVQFNEVSPFVFDCLVATEDERYFNHAGIDFKALPRVFSGALMGDQSSGGGSTITQQLAKMLFHDPVKNKFERVKQKLKEWIIAARLEKSYTKEEIMTMYLNKFDFINNAVGIHSAARVYFNTTPDSLSLEKAAMLVGMCQNPSRYNPRRFQERAIKRREIVLYQLMRNSDNPDVKTKITREQYDSLRALPLGLDFQKVDHVEGPAPYYREELRKELTELFNKKDDDGNYIYHKKNGDKYDIYEDGLKIYTTIDSRMQRYAEFAVMEHLGKELQKDFDKDNKRWKNPPFSNDVEPEEIEKLLTSSMHRSARYKILSGTLCGNCERTSVEVKGDTNYCTYCQYKSPHHSEKEIEKVFDTPVKMRVFTWAKEGYETDTVLSPMDSIRYYKRFLQAGLMSMDPHTGFIKAWVGGANFKHFQYDHVKQGKRQVGSTFKPFVYAAAFRDRVLSPCSTAPDIEHCIEVPHTATTTKPWCPRNAGAAYSGEQIPLYWALAASMNNITAFIMRHEKPALVIKLVEDLGIEKGTLDPVPSICLGSCDLSVYEMVGAQSAFANKGVYIQPIMYTRIEDRNGNVIFDVEPVTREAMDEYTAYMMLEIMKGTTSGAVNPVTGKVAGTGLRIRSSAKPYGGLKIPIAGKTGTTQNQSDGWFIGLTPDLVTGVWVGAEDRSVRFSTVSLGMGTNMALPIWGYYMKKVIADNSIKISHGDFEKPEGFPDEIFSCKDGKRAMNEIWNSVNLEDVEKTEGINLFEGPEGFQLNNHNDFE